MPGRTRRYVWAGRVAAGAMIAGLGVYLWAAGPGQDAVVAGPVTAVAAVAALLAPYLLPAYQAPSGQRAATVIHPRDVPSSWATGVELAISADQLNSLPRANALLIIKRGPKASVGSRYLLNQELAVIGRTRKSDIFLDDESISRQHALIYRKARRFYVSDLRSLNGTYLNQDRVYDDMPLKSGDELAVGKFKMLFFKGTASA